MRLTEENIKEVAKLAIDGKNPKEIADMLNVKPEQVFACLRKLRSLGVKLPSSRSGVYKSVAKELISEQEGS